MNEMRCMRMRNRSGNLAGWENNQSEGELQWNGSRIGYEFSCSRYVEVNYPSLLNIYCGNPSNSDTRADTSVPTGLWSRVFLAPRCITICRSPGLLGT